MKNVLGSRVQRLVIGHTCLLRAVVGALELLIDSLPNLRNNKIGEKRCVYFERIEQHCEYELVPNYDIPLRNIISEVSSKLFLNESPDGSISGVTIRV